MFARAEEGNEVNGRTCGVGESEVDSDALQDLLWDGEQRRGMDEHGGRRGGKGKSEEGNGRGSVKVYMEMALILLEPDSRDVDRQSFPPAIRFPLRLPFPLTVPCPGLPSDLPFAEIPVSINTTH
jgi:hypothetical protein